jgi:NADH-quinone oxidoreductase subunit K
VGSGEERRVIVPVSYYLVLSAILFGLGVVAFVFKRNVITIFMSIELMLNAVNLAFVAFARAHNQLDGLVFVFFVIVVAAAEAAVGLAIVITLVRNRESLNVERVNLLKF